MQEVAVNYEIRQGDDFVTQLTITDQNAAIVNLTGATVVMRVNDRNGTNLSETTVTTHTTPLSGITTITIADTVTATYPLGCFDFDTVVTLSTGSIFTVEDGTLNVRYAD